MADRAYHRMDVQGVRHVEYNFSVTYAAGAPAFTEGDKVGALVGSYVSLVQTGTGVLTITTVDKFIAIVGVAASIGMATPTGNVIVTHGKPVLNANGTQSVTINTATNAAGTHTAATVANGDMLYVRLVLRNSQVTP